MGLSLRGMSVAQHQQTKGHRAVARWILAGVVMLLIQVVLGGVTRLTGSGLSITEWNVVTGTLPPLDHHGWLSEFGKYRETPQYRHLNTDFSLADFKFIYFWEWMHRLWARLIGLVFVVGFVYLTAKRYLHGGMARPMLILFLLGALQGAVGWIMVASGLTGDAVYVKPTRLALHFIFAMGLIAYAYWFLLQLRIPNAQRLYAPRVRRMAIWLVAIVSIQLVFGALMAGHKAATAAPTWPGINGSLLPAAAFSHEPLLVNFIDNKIAVHFVHRSLAALVTVLVVFFTLTLYRVNSPTEGLRKMRLWPAMLVAAQVALGISSVLASPGIVPNHWNLFEWLAQLHQVTGMLFFLSIVHALYLVRRSP